MNNKISVVIHTYNNEKIIRECLESVKDFDEIVICDMYSSDKTLEIAKEYNAKIVMHENIGWADPARNFAIQQASNEWVLVVDSDEVITKDLKEHLYKIIHNNSNNNNIVSAFKLPRKNYCWGEFMHMLYPDYIIRFFKKDAIYWPPYVHATLEIKEGIIDFIDCKNEKLAIIHNTNCSVSNLLNAINTYCGLEVEKMIRDKKKFKPVYAVYRSFFLIIEKFIFKGGYKDGIRGLIVSVLFYGVYRFCSVFKYWEYLEKNRGNND